MNHAIVSLCFFVAHAVLCAVCVHLERHALAVLLGLVAVLMALQTVSDLEALEGRR